MSWRDLRKAIQRYLVEFPAAVGAPSHVTRAMPVPHAGRFMSLVHTQWHRSLPTIDLCQQRLAEHLIQGGGGGRSGRNAPEGFEQLWLARNPAERALAWDALLNELLEVQDEEPNSH